MKQFLVTIILFASLLPILQSQTTTMKFVVSFTDKTNSIYSISNPSAYLSQRAIERRDKQGIPITKSDLPVNSNYIDSVKQLGVDISHSSKWLNAVLIVTGDSSKIDDIKNLSFVNGVELLFWQKTIKSGNKQGTNFYNSESTIDNSGLNTLSEKTLIKGINQIDYGNGFSQANMLAVNYLHQLGFRGDSMIIAVLDAGFNSVNSLDVFDSLYQQNRLIGAIDLVEKGGDVYSGHTHGLMVLSTMAANKPGELVGTAPDASYLLIRTEDGGSEFPVEEYYWVVGAEYADSAGADLINSSLGYSDFDISDFDYTYADMDGKHAISSIGATIAASKGMIVVNSAGNEGYSPWHYISAPGDADSIITVGAVDVSGNYAPFSSTGPTFDDRIKPDVCAMGQGAFVANTDGSIISGNGTSFSSPVMCGAVACLWQANSDKGNMEIIEIVQRSSSQYTFPDSLKGYGIPNFAIAHLLLGGSNIPDINSQQEIEIVPNPFQDEFFITFQSGDTEKVMINIVDIEGAIVYSKELRKNSGYNCFHVNDVSFLRSGVYILRINNNGKEITKKIIKY